MLTDTQIQELQRLAEAADALRHANHAITEAAVKAYRAGAPWSSVGSILGISRQAAQQRFTPKLVRASASRLF